MCLLLMAPEWRAGCYPNSLADRATNDALTPLPAGTCMNFCLTMLVLDHDETL
jgi:hypothetical protein